MRRPVSKFGNYRSGQRGIMSVEFMIVAPVLLLLMLCIAEFGHALYQYNTLTKSVRDGARYLASNSTVGNTGTVIIDSTDITETENLVVYGNTAGNGAPKVPGLSINDITVSCLGGGTACPGVEHVVADHHHGAAAGLLVATGGVELGPADLAPQYSGHSARSSPSPSSASARSSVGSRRAHSRAIHTLFRLASDTAS